MKSFKTHNQQLRILRSRGLSVPYGGKAKRVLENTNYYGIVNAYKEPFIDKSCSTEQYKPGAIFDELHELFLMDRALRSAFFPRIMVIENNIKAVIAYTFSALYGHDNYLTVNNFEKSGGAKRVETVTQLIADVQQDLAERMKKNAAVKHYLTNYGYVPLWVLINILTLGRVNVFLMNMKQPDRQMVGKHFELSDKQLIAFLSVMVFYRNLCAHDERFYDARCHPSLIPSTSIHSQLKLKKNPQDEYTRGKTDLLALLIIMKYMLPSRDFNKLVGEIDSAISKATKQLHTIGPNDVLIRMGFPANWKDIVKCVR